MTAYDFVISRYIYKRRSVVASASSILHFPAAERNDCGESRDEHIIYTYIHDDRVLRCAIGGNRDTKKDARAVYNSEAEDTNTSLICAGGGFSRKFFCAIIMTEIIYADFFIRSASKEKKRRTFITFNK